MNLRPEYLTTDGVYRQSGNLSVVQRLRLQIDQGNLGVLDTVDDVHVLTGALKLFFRELQEPLVPWEVVCSSPSDSSVICLIIRLQNKPNLYVPPGCGETAGSSQFAEQKGKAETVERDHCQVLPCQITSHFVSFKAAFCHLAFNSS